MSTNLWKNDIRDIFWWQLLQQMIVFLFWITDTTGSFSKPVTHESCLNILKYKYKKDQCGPKTFMNHFTDRILIFCVKVISDGSKSWTTDIVLKTLRRFGFGLSKISTNFQNESGGFQCWKNWVAGWHYRAPRSSN